MADGKRPDPVETVCRMPTREASSDISDALTLSPHAKGRFYELIVLLHALNQVCSRPSQRRAPDSPRIRTADLGEPEDMLRLYISKLAKMCDSRPGGATVTAFAALQNTDPRVRYVFASNSRTPDELETIRKHIGDVLLSVGELSRATHTKRSREEAHRQVQRKILRFCRDRIKCYVNGLTEALSECIGHCMRDTSKDAQLYVEKLRGLQDTMPLHVPVLDVVEKLLKRLKCLRDDTPLRMFISRRLDNDRAGNPGPWRELHHHSGRLLSYGHLVEDLRIVAAIWPELFDDFDVVAIPSGACEGRPVGAKVKSASDLVKRHSPEKDRAHHASLLQEVDHALGAGVVDAAVAKQWRCPSFRPLVHAEVAVLNWLEHSGAGAGTRPQRFFRNVKFIGCSKPPCMLCQCYFAEHRSGVGLRGGGPGGGGGGAGSGHHDGNLYPAWRMPDRPDVGPAGGGVSACCGGGDGDGGGSKQQEEVRQTRLAMMNALRERVRQKAWRVLAERVSDRREHDSVTTSETLVGRVEGE